MLQEIRFQQERRTWQQNVFKRDEDDDKNLHMLIHSKLSRNGVNERESCSTQLLLLKTMRSLVPEKRMSYLKQEKI